MSDEHQYKVILRRFLPENYVDTAFVLLKNDNVNLKITKTRNTKLGDYRPPFNGKGHRITINGELNPFEFLITFLHEFAHLNINKSFGNKVKPHGKEWKLEFRNLLSTVLKKDIFPTEIEEKIEKVVFSKKGFSNILIDELRLKMGEYSKRQKILVKDLEIGTKFLLKSGRTFVLGEKRRTRYSCKEIGGHRVFSVHPLAEVVEVL
ncbi:MAG: SprT-like domain-containing protein [Bacteroidales bacterium]|nr:SprT-like domain-containing protein [Bacteroidales bacterium]